MPYAPVHPIYAVNAVIMQTFHENGLTAFLVGGSALGAYRHHGFTPDSAAHKVEDIDIGTFATSAEVESTLAKIMGAHPDFKLSVSTHYGIWKVHCASEPHCQLRRFDIWLYRHEGRTIVEQGTFGNVVPDTWFFRRLLPDSVYGNFACGDWNWSLSLGMYGNTVVPTLGEECLDDHLLTFPHWLWYTSLDYLPYPFPVPWRDGGGSDRDGLTWTFQRKDGGGSPIIYKEDHVNEVALVHRNASSGREDLIAAQKKRTDPEGVVHSILRSKTCIQRLHQVKQN